MAITINLADGIDGVAQRIAGAAAGDEMGNAASGGTDVNGDGIADLILGARVAGGNDNGAAYVVFGGSAAFDSEIELANLGSAGIVFSGAANYDSAGFDVAIGNDINGDGIGDILIGALYADGAGNDRGKVYVVFGDASLASSIALGSLGAAGFEIAGEMDGDQAGTSVAFVGDVDNDGTGDFLVGAPGNANAGSNAGAAYLIFGTAGLGADVDLGGFAGDAAFQGVAINDRLATVVAGAGNLNGDNYNDILLVASGADGGDGAIYSAFGASSLGAVTSIGSLGAGGFASSGAGGSEPLNEAAIVGDVNNDGFDDFVVGSRNGTDVTTYLVFGAAGLGADLNLSSLGASGIRLTGDPTSAAGLSVAAAGDFNGDGIDDFVIGAPTDGTYANLAGAVFVIFGRSGGFSTDIDLTALGDDEGVMIAGAAQSDFFGQSVAGIGDVDGDGIDDILAGATGVDANGVNSGAAYVIFGFTTVTGTAGNDSLAGGNGRDSVSGAAGNDTLVGNAGNDTLDGGLGDDSLDGGADDDMLVSGTGNDSLFGGAGTDTADLSFGNIGDVEVRLLSGAELTGLLSRPSPADGVSVQAVFTGAAVRMQFVGQEASFQLMASDIEAVRFGDGTVDLSEIVDLDLADTGVEDIFAGGSGDNTLTGRDTDDVMAAGAGNDSIDGGAGNDRAYGQAGNDSLVGGAGNDSLFGNLGTDTVAGGIGDDSLKAQTDDDMLLGEAGNDVAFGGGNDDSINGGDGSDTLNGNSGFDTLLGGAGNDTLRGQGGRDSLNGGDGDDLLLGMQGFDTLVGGDGNDGLIGGPANDTLTGGSGADFFTFAAGQGSNTITDFEDGTDTISMQGVADFGDLAIADGGSGAVVTIAAGGDGLSITLTGISASQLSAADFFFA